MNKKSFLKRIVSIFYVFFFLLMCIKFGYCENYYPDGLDRVKWGMSFEEVLKIVKDEGRQTGTINPSRGYLNTKGEIFGYVAIVDYHFQSDKLTKIIFEPIKIQVGLDEGNHQYAKFRATLIKIFGPPSVNDANRNEAQAIWKYADDNPSIEISSWPDKGDYLQGIKVWKTYLTISAPDFLNDKQNDMIKDKTISLISTTTPEEAYY